MTRIVAQNMAAFAERHGLAAIARPAKYAEAWVVEIKGRPYGTIYNVEKTVADHLGVSRWELVRR